MMLSSDNSTVLLNMMYLSGHDPNYVYGISVSTLAQLYSFEIYNCNGCGGAFLVVTPNSTIATVVQLGSISGNHPQLVTFNTSSGVVTNSTSLTSINSQQMAAIVLNSRYIWMLPYTGTTEYSLDAWTGTIISFTGSGTYTLSKSYNLYPEASGQIEWNMLPSVCLTSNYALYARNSSGNGYMFTISPYASSTPYYPAIPTQARYAVLNGYWNRIEGVNALSDSTMQMNMISQTQQNQPTITALPIESPDMISVVQNAEWLAWILSSNTSKATVFGNTAGFAGAFNAVDIGGIATAFAVSQSPLYYVASTTSVFVTFLSQFPCPSGGSCTGAAIYGNGTIPAPGVSLSSISYLGISTPSVAWSGTVNVTINGTFTGLDVGATYWFDWVLTAPSAPVTPVSYIYFDVIFY
jgi:hypothetical protein